MSILNNFFFVESNGMTMAMVGGMPGNVWGKPIYYKDIGGATIIKRTNGYTITVRNKTIFISNK